MIEYANYTLKNDYLLLEAGGSISKLQELVGGTDRLNDKAKESGARKLLADFREISFDVKLNDAFNLVRYYENRTPEFKNMHIAGVMQKRDLEIGKFYESICRKRGFNASIFTDFAQAEEWLLKQ